MADFKVLIIGAGLSGSLLANGLLRNGVQCEVYERSERDAKREGYQIRLGDSAMAGMRACLEDAHIKKIVACFGHTTEAQSEAPIIYDTSFKKVLDLSQMPAYSKSAPISRVVLRDLLCEPLYEKGALKYGKQFSRYSVVKNAEGEKICAWFSDGSSVQCDVLIGADGNQSKVNKQLGCNNIEMLDSHMIIQAKCDLPHGVREKLCPDLMQAPVGTCSGNMAYFFCVYLPTTQQEAHKTNMHGEPAASCMLGMTVPVKLLPSSFEEMTNDERWDVIAGAFKTWSPIHRQTVELLRGQYLYSVWPRVGHQPASNWRASAMNNSDETRGHPRVWLLGDAIHPMLPNRGMGGNQAMRDAADALPLLVDLAKRAESGRRLETIDMKRACDQYEQKNDSAGLPMGQIKWRQSGHGF